MRKYAKVHKSAQKYAKVHKSMPKCTKVRESGQKYAYCEVHAKHAYCS